MGTVFFSEGSIGRGRGAGDVLELPLKMTAIIKVVGDFCNLKCAYCFYNQRDQLVRHVMDRDLLEKFIREYLELFSENPTFIWHGGEPLLAGIDFFADAVRFQGRYCRPDSAVRNTIQTNATLVTEEWAAFFAANGFGVGVSLDGDRESHDRFRTTGVGRGSFDRVMRGVAILERHGLRPGFIQTLTRSNLHRAAQDFSFFATLPGGTNWGVNAFFGFDGIDELNDAMRKQRITPSELAAFSRQSIDAWLEADDPRIRIREIENFLAGVVGKRARDCTFNGTCAWYF